MEHHHHEHHHDDDHPISQEEAFQSLLQLGQVALEAQDFESAVQALASAEKLGDDEGALVSLASLYARGLGTSRDYLEAARLYHKAELMGHEQAGKLCGKCMYDFVNEDFDGKGAVNVFASMIMFVTNVYPEAVNQRGEVNRGLLAVAGTLLEHESHAKAAKVFRAAAEFGNSAQAQYYLAVLYNSGSGVPESDLAALYWIDKAADGNLGEAVSEERDAMLEAYRAALSDEEFSQMLATLAEMCSTGTADIPQDEAKASKWRAR